MENWTAGQIVWARLGSFSYWPSMVYPLNEQYSGMCTLKLENSHLKRNNIHLTLFCFLVTINFEGPKVCVKFFADRETIAYVTDDRLLNFEGLEKFECYGIDWKDNQIDKLKNKKSKKIVSFSFCHRSLNGNIRFDLTLKLKTILWQVQINREHKRRFSNDSLQWRIAECEANILVLIPIEWRRFFYDRMLLVAMYVILNLRLILQHK